MLVSYIALQTNNSVRNFSAVNPDHFGNVGEKHDKASGKLRTSQYCCQQKELEHKIQKKVLHIVWLAKSTSLEKAMSSSKNLASS